MNTGQPQLQEVKRLYLFIFSDIFAQNIALGDEQIDREKLLNAVEIANIKEFIESLPSKYNTIIGTQGDGVSSGQRQRILIARAIYKNPEYIFLMKRRTLWMQITRKR